MDTASFYSVLMILVLGLYPLQAQDTSNQYAELASKNILVISIPKSGTHLLMKHISLLSQKGFTYISYLYLNKKQFTQSYIGSHLPYSNQLIAKILNNSITTFFIYRDPRDQVVSFAFYARTSLSFKHMVHPKLKMPIHAIPLAAIITDLINDGSWLYTIWGPVPVKGIYNFYMLFLPWKWQPNVYSLTFEKLIGPLGGGTIGAQRQQINNILLHLGLTPTETIIQNIAKNLFGNSPTFREGKIGSWKRYFTQKDKEDFKRIAGQLLIDLGYEKNFNW